MDRGLTNYFHLNMIATVTTTKPTGLQAVTTRLINRGFLLNRWHMLTDGLATLHMRRIAKTMGIPFHGAMAKKVLETSISLSEIGRTFAVKGGQPFVTVVVAVENGEVTRVVGEFDRGDEELDDGWDTEEED